MLLVEPVIRAWATPLTSRACHVLPQFALVRRYIMMPHAKAERDGEESGRGSPASVTAALVGTGGSELSGFLTGRLLDTARAALGESADRVRSSRLLA